jgi:hypothetical protein
MVLCFQASKEVLEESRTFRRPMQEGIGTR